MPKWLIDIMTMIQALRFKIRMIEAGMCNGKKPLVQIGTDWENYDDISELKAFYSGNEEKHFLGKSSVIKIGDRIIQLEQEFYFWKDVTK